MIQVDLNGKVAVVTAAGTQLGTAIAKALAENGATVAVLDADLKKAEQAAAAIGAKAKAYEADVMKKDTLMGVCKQIEEDLGSLDILVNNEKDTLPKEARKPLHEVDMDRYYAIADRELLGLYYMTKAAMQGMAARKNGIVVNITSALGLTPQKGMIANVATATATISLTRVWALEMTPDNIRVHAVARGELPYENEVSADAIDHMATKRPLAIADVVGAVLYSVSDEAAYENGSVITVDGGLHYGFMRNF